MALQPSPIFRDTFDLVLNDNSEITQDIVNNHRSIYLDGSYFYLTGNIALPSNTWITGKSREGTTIDLDGNYIESTGSGGSDRYYYDIPNIQGGLITLDHQGTTVSGSADEAGINTQFTSITNPDTLRVFGIPYNLASVTDDQNATLENQYVGRDVRAKFFELVKEQSNIVIEHLKIINPSTTSTPMVFWSCNRIYLNDLRVVGTGPAGDSGVQFYYCDGAVVTGVYGEHFGEVGGMGAVIFVSRSRNVIVSDCHVTNCIKQGIVFRKAWSCICSNNVAANCEIGFWSCEGSRILFVNNSVLNCDRGFTVTGEKNLVIGNVITDVDVGVYREESAEFWDPKEADGSTLTRKWNSGAMSPIEGNTITRARYIAIDAYRASNCSIVGNVIGEGGYIKNGFFKWWLYEDGDSSHIPTYWEPVTTGDASTQILETSGTYEGLTPLYSSFAVDLDSGTGANTSGIKQRFSYKTEHYDGTVVDGDLTLWLRRGTGTTGTFTVGVYAEDDSAIAEDSGVNLNTVETGRWTPYHLSAGSIDPATYGWCYVKLEVSFDAADYHLYVDGVKFSDIKEAGIVLRGENIVSGNQLSAVGGHEYGAITQEFEPSEDPNGEGSQIYGNLIECAGGHACQINAPKTIFSSNKIRGVGLNQYGIWIRNFDATISGNDIDCQNAAMYAIEITPGYESIPGGGTYPVSGANVVNNRITGLDANLSGSTYIRIAGENSRVAGNLIVDDCYTVDDTNGVFYGADNIDISDNIIHVTNAKASIYGAYSGNQDIKITGNDLKNTNGSYTMFCQDKGLIITDNTCEGGGGTTGRIALWDNVERSTVTNNSLTNCQLYLNTVTDSVASHNTVSGGTDLKLNDPTRCRVIGNSVVGGGELILEDAVTNCVVNGNLADGGEIRVTNPTSSTVVGNIVTDSQLEVTGGTNILVSSNFANDSNVGSLTDSIVIGNRFVSATTIQGDGVDGCVVQHNIHP